MSKYTNRPTLIGVFVLIAICVIAYLLLYVSSPHIDLAEQTYKRLKELREDKKQLTLDYFKSIEVSAERLATDKTLQSQFLRLKSTGNVVPSNQLIHNVDRHFITNYGDFYDLLFVDTSGFVFHSIRQEEDFQKNLLTGKLNNTSLSKALQGNQQTKFSSFEFYGPSDEPAAFFIALVSIQNQHAGWLILQCAINRVNTILTNRHQMGRTEEVYLVNDEKLMLSESRFIEDGTILKLKVNTESVRQALNANSGESVITDYRGARVYSSFERFEHFNTTWIIIAEIDESEVITEHYKRHTEYFNNAILTSLSEMEHHSIQTIPEITSEIKVDVNEWAKGIPGQSLQTIGFSTCTAFSIHYPSKFTYLAHISGIDAAYGVDGLAKFFLKGRATDFVGELTSRVRFYDIYPSELQKLEFLIIATHANSFPLIVERLLEQGIDLGQIKFIYNPNAQSASLNMDVIGSDATITWYSGSSAILESPGDYENLQQIIEKKY